METKLYKQKTNKEKIVKESSWDENIIELFCVLLLAIGPIPGVINVPSEGLMGKTTFSFAI